MISSDGMLLRLFGKVVRLNCTDKNLKRRIEAEMSLYPASSKSAADLKVNIVPDISFEAAARNPSIHAENGSQWFIQSSMADIKFTFEGGELKEVDFKLNKAQKLLHKKAQKWANMQFTNRQERVGQILHEVVFIPVIYFMKDRVPVHSSAFSLDGGVTLIGGTGGVGKTSLELELCRTGQAKFVADDITVLSDSGIVYPNLNWPKIYGYNVEGDPGLKKKLVANTQLMDSLHWRLHALRGKDKVRRRISPSALYGEFEQEELPLRRYIILARTNTPSIKSRPISAEKAAEASVEIMKTEYSWFHNHLDWHQLHSVITDNEPVTSSGEIFERWQKSLEQLFSEIDCRLISIPLSMNHNSFKKEMVSRLLAS